MTIDVEPLRVGGPAFYAKCHACLFVSEPYGDAASADVLGSVHRCD